MSLCVGILLHKPYRAVGVILLHFSHSCFGPRPPPSQFIALPDSSITFPISGRDGLFFLPFPLLLPLVFMFFLGSLAQALRVMKSCHDFDSVVIEESLVAIREHYSIRTKVRRIANSKDSILMQGLVHGRRSVRGHPKVRSKLGAMEHQNFLFNMERIRP
ncbi:hypothetical protein BHM03_00050266 [Ensete ventricosum]|nr:hypothetical protein BHM03_00050266 [Ensete ventricosum]